VKIHIGADVKNIPADTDLIVYSLAWDDMEFEFMGQVRALGIPILTYFEALGLFSKHKKTIAIAGTHGKTTTTAMVAKMMVNAKLDPTVVVGSILAESHTNFIAGSGGYFVVEACEYRRSFLNLHPSIAIITNIDNDHLDYYKDMNDIISAFREFVSLVPEDGYVITDLSDREVAAAIQGARAKVIDFSQYDISHLDLKVPGEHNRKNAQAAIALADVLGIDSAKAIEALDDFAGTWRRFEFKGGTKGGAIVYDDYGHHPTEVKATLSGAREKFPDRKITVVFQPHLYSRTKILLDDFAYAFKDADNVVLAPIYAAREESDPSINSGMLAEKIRVLNKSVNSFTDFRAITEHLKKSLNQGDILITMGAGDIYKVGEKLVVSD
jgi:UDP-N-acetylmuramate--alanine ligase